MAKITPGPLIGAISGSIGGATYSKNRYGLYIRNRSIPVNPGTTYQLEQRATISSMSKSWGLLTDAGRQAWKTWCQNNPVMDVLGNAQVLTGHAAFVRLNTRLYNAGETPLTAPPATSGALAFSAFSATFDIGAGDFAVTFAPTPVGAANRIVFWAAVVSSSGISYVNNLWKQVFITARNVATGVDLQANIEERFGTLQVGQVVHIKGVILNTTTGLVSGPALTHGAVVTT